MSILCAAVLATVASVPCLRGARADPLAGILPVRPPVSRLSDRPLLPTGIVRMEHDGTSEEERRREQAEGEARGVRLVPLYALVKSGRFDEALEAARLHRRRYAGLGDEYVVDVIVVRMLIELDREREALLEMEQSESMQFSLQSDTPSNMKAINTYLCGRAGRVWQPFWTAWLVANQTGRTTWRSVLGEQDPRYERSFVPMASDSIAAAAVRLAWDTEQLSGPSLLRILRRAHEAVPDEPNVKRALAEAEWRIARDYEKALRLVREVIAVAGLEHIGSLKQEEGRYAAALRYQRDHGGG